MSLPYFPMYPADFEADTSHLTLEEDGAYNRLLRLCWMTPGCSLPDDHTWITRRMRIDAATFDRVVLPLLAEFFRRGNGRVSSPRLTAVHGESIEKHTRRVEAGKKGGRPAKALFLNETGKSNAKAMPKQPEPEPDKKKESGKPLSVRSEHFEAFWASYPPKGKVGKKAATTKFEAAMKSGVPPDRIISAALAYAASETVLRGYVKHAATWINQGCWDDDPQSAQIHTLITGGPHDRPSAADQRRADRTERDSRILRIAAAGTTRPP